MDKIEEGLVSSNLMIFKDLLVLNLIKKEEFIMEVVEISCNNCGKPIYVLQDFIRPEMFCTLRCMELYGQNKKVDKVSLKI